MWCCYLLTPTDARKSGRVTYVGFTVDPGRRLRQHNGELVAGAKRTKRHGEWRFVGVVLGFPSKFSALSFEYAWQHPHRSRLCKARMEPFRRLRGFGPPQSVKRKLIQLKVLLGACFPFVQFALSLHLLRADEAQFFASLSAGSLRNQGAAVELQGLTELPAHMDVTVGQDLAARVLECRERYDAAADQDRTLEAFPAAQQEAQHEIVEDDDSNACVICSRPFLKGRAIMRCTQAELGEGGESQASRRQDQEHEVQERMANVVDLVESSEESGEETESARMSPGCCLQAHPTCLAGEFASPRLIPSQGPCPVCGTLLKWPDLVLKATTLSS